MIKNYRFVEVNKIVYLLGISFYLIGIIIALAPLTDFLDAVINHKKHILDYMYLFVYFEFGAIIAYYGRSLKSVYMNASYFFEDRISSFNDITEFQYTYIWCFSFAGLIILSMAVSPNYAIGEYTLPIFGFTLFVSIIQTAIIFHYKKLVESQNK